MAGRSANTAPAGAARAVTAHDTNTLTGGTCRSLYIGVAGDVVAILADGNTAVTFKNVAAGVLPIQASIVKSTGTTATDIVALY